MTTFELQTSLTNQICAITGETRTTVLVEAYRQVRIPGVNTSSKMTIPALESMLAFAIDQYILSN